MPCKQIIKSSLRRIIIVAAISPLLSLIFKNIYTCMQKLMIPDTHRQSVAIGLIWGKQCANKVLQNANLARRRNFTP